MGNHAEHCKSCNSGTDLLDARGPAVIARLQHLWGLSLLDHHHPQSVPDHALHAVKVLDLWEPTVGLITLRSRHFTSEMLSEGLIATGHTYGHDVLACGE